MKKPFGYVDHRAIHQPDDKGLGAPPSAVMNTEDQFKAQKKALEFQEMYYPSECLLKQHAQSEAIRFAFAQGFEMAQRAMQERLDEMQEDLDFANEKGCNFTG